MWAGGNSRKKDLWLVATHLERGGRIHAGEIGISNPAGDIDDGPYSFLDPV